MNDNILKIESLSKTYKKNKVKANDNISINIASGEIVALIGHNGAGKTTLLNQIIGNIKPDFGNITYNGISFVRDARMARELVSMMPQFHAPLVGVTLRQSIESILRIRGLSGIDDSVDMILQKLDIKKWANTPGNKLSGGLQRLTSFAMATTKPSDIILLDEPTNDVDPVRRKLQWKHMKELAGDGHIVLVVTHNLLEVEQYADRYILLDNGKVIRDSNTNELGKHSNSNVLSVTLTDDYSSYNLPSCEKYSYIKDENQVDIFMSYNQIFDSMQWLLQMINEGKISSYKLTNATLDLEYGGMVDGEGGF